MLSKVGFKDLLATQAEILFFLGTTFADLLSGSMRLLPMMMTEPHVI